MFERKSTGHVCALLLLAAAACSGEMRTDTMDGLPRALGSGHLLGIFCGNETRDIEQFEDWLGRQVDGFLGNVGMEN